MSVDWQAGVAAVITGFAAIVSAAGGVLLIIRSVRDKERRAAKADYAQLSRQLRAERDARVTLEELVYLQRDLLARHGIARPVGEVPAIAQADDDADDDADADSARGLPALGGRILRGRADARGVHRRDRPGGEREQ